MGFFDLPTALISKTLGGGGQAVQAIQNPVPVRYTRPGPINPPARPPYVPFGISPTTVMRQSSSGPAAMLMEQAQTQSVGAYANQNVPHPEAPTPYPAPPAPPPVKTVGYAQGSTVGSEYGAVGTSGRIQGDPGKGFVIASSNGEGSGHPSGGDFLSFGSGMSLPMIIGIGAVVILGGLYFLYKGTESALDRGSANLAKGQEFLSGNVNRAWDFADANPQIAGDAASAAAKLATMV